MDKSINIKIIIGSTRQNRFGGEPAAWVAEAVKTKAGFLSETLDLRDYPMPFFDEPVSPSMAKEPYANEVVNRFREKIKEADAFIIVTPEYNHGYPAVLKNAMDYLYYEWNNKPVAFVSYGAVGGARSIEQLRLVSVELQMAPIRNAINIPWTMLVAVRESGIQALEPLKAPLDSLLMQLLWWGRALKNARAK